MYFYAVDFIELKYFPSLSSHTLGMCFWIRKKKEMIYVGTAWNRNTFPVSILTQRARFWIFYEIKISLYSFSTARTLRKHVYQRGFDTSAYFSTCRCHIHRAQSKCLPHPPHTTDPKTLAICMRTETEKIFPLQKISIRVACWVFEIRKRAQCKS